MWFALKRLSLGAVLIALAAATLLISDWNQRKADANRTPHMAVFQFTATAAQEESVRGIGDALRHAGFVDGRNIRISYFNALGEMATANAIAKQVTEGDYDIIVTLSTPMLQAVANNNKNGKTVHVFGLVADPFAAGVGLHRDRPWDHPPHLTGFGTLLPVEDSFRLARKFFPALQTLGVVWNPSEANSAAYLKRARAVGVDQGIRIIEAPVENTAAVLEAAQSLVARGAQALWAGGDSTVNVAIDSIIKLAKEARIPIFSIVPADPQRGTLFDLGADFYQVGYKTGELALRVLRGTDPKTIPIENYAPKRLVVNELALAGLKDDWRLPPGLRETAEVFVDASGVHQKKLASDTKAKSVVPIPLAKQWKIDIIEYITTPETEEGEK
ncbi:MAG TPA: ABC transporter substrate-binding protein, partial [Candidatus Binatia bacterium]|nr:ABC transporter substrate-binding protein [Candidatus Binatia bacterium]